MSVGGSGSSGNSQTEIDPQFKQAWLDTLNMARQTANGLGSPPDVKAAGLSADQQAADSYLNGHLSQGDQAMNQAEQLAYKAGHYGPGDVDPMLLDAAKVKQVDPAQAYSFDGAKVGDMVKANAFTADPVKLGKASDYGAALIDRSKVDQVDPGALTDVNLKRYMNPYEDQVVDSTISDMERARRIQREADKSDAITHRAFGGSREAVQHALTDDAFQRNLAGQIGQLRQSGYGAAAGLAESDLDRGLTGQVQNQSTSLAIQSANQGSKNAAGQFGAQAQNAFDLADAANRLNNNQFNARNATDNSQYNSGQVNAAKLAEAANRQQAGMADAGFLTDVSKYNTGLEANRAQTNAELALKAGLANQSTALAAGQSNQAAGLQANQQQLGAAAALGQLAGGDQQMTLNNVAALNTQGGITRDVAQQQLDAGYKNAMADYQVPLQKLQTVESAFGIMPSTAQGSSSSSNAKSVAGGLGG